MKLKKLLAAVTAAALAVTTMAVTSFTASAAAEKELYSGSKLLKAYVAGSNDHTMDENMVIDGSDLDDYSNLTVVFSLNQETIDDIYSTENDNKWKGQQVLSITVKANDKYSSAWEWIGTNKYIGINAYGEVFNADVDITASIPTNDIKEALSGQSGFDYKTMVNSIILQNGNVKSVTVKKVALTDPTDNTVYVSKAYTPERSNDADIFFDGTWDLSKAVGPNARVEFTFKNNDASGGFAVCDASVEEYWTKQLLKGDSSKTSFKISEIESAGFGSPLKIMINGWNGAIPTGMIIYNGSADTLYTPAGGTTDTDEPTVTLTPATASVAAESTTDLTVTKANADDYIFEVSSSDDTKATAALSEDGTKVTVTGVAEGTATITVTGKKAGADDITASCEVTVVAAGEDIPAEGTEAWSENAGKFTYKRRAKTDADAENGSSVTALNIPFANIGVPAEDISKITKVSAVISADDFANGCIGLNDGETWKQEGYESAGASVTCSVSVNGTNSDALNIQFWWVNFGTKVEVSDITVVADGKTYVYGSDPDDGSGSEDNEHTHTGGTATCQAKAVCTVCGQEYGGYAAHNYADGVCTVCGAKEPVVTPPVTPPANPEPSEPSYAAPSTNPSPVNSTTIVDTILAIPDGGNGSVNLGSSAKLDKIAMESLLAKGDITVRFNVSGGAYWEISGKNVTEAKAVDLGIRMNSTLIPESKVNEFAGDKNTLQFSLKHNGEFGFTGILNIPVSKSYNGKFANLYYYHGGKFDFVGSSAVSDGRAKFAFTHASNYLVVFDDYAYGEDVSSAAGIVETTAETSEFPFAASLVVISAFGVSAIVLKKRLSK